MAAISHSDHRDDGYLRVTVSLLKRHLQEEMSPETRLQFVGSLETWAADLGADVVASIKPMCDQAYAIVEKRGSIPAMDLFTDEFTTFAALNPSLVASPTLRIAH